jgi:hypothetical protein
VQKRGSFMQDGRLTPGKIPPSIRHLILDMMPLSRKTEISDEDLDDLAAYLTRNNR